MKHTPGIWYVNAYDVILVPYKNGLKRIANCNVWLGNKEERRANAQLIAAAPEMLKLLEDIAKWNKRDKEVSFDLHPWYQKLIIVIAKAKGQI